MTSLATHLPPPTRDVGHEVVPTFPHGKSAELPLTPTDLFATYGGCHLRNCRCSLDKLSVPPARLATKHAKLFRTLGGPSADNPVALGLALGGPRPGPLVSLGRGSSSSNFSSAKPAKLSAAYDSFLTSARPIGRPNGCPLGGVPPKATYPYFPLKYHHP